MQMQKGGGSGAASLRDEAIGEEEEDLQVDDNEHISMQSEANYQQVREFLRFKHECLKRMYHFIEPTK